MRLAVRDRTAHQHDPASGRPEAPITLDQPAARTFGVGDQIGLWANLGVSLLGFTGALVVWQPGGPGTPHLPIVAALLATAIGTVIGTAAVAVSGLIGTRTGQPSMVILRGVFGGRLSYLPSVLNVIQLAGWTTFELVTIATAVNTITGIPAWPVVVAGGIVTTLLAVYPLSWIRVLRRYVTVLVAAAMVYLGVRLLLGDGGPLSHPGGSDWSGFAIAVDSCVAVAASYVPMAADYARHSVTGRAGVVGTLVGYSIAQIACYAVGLVALLAAGGDTDRVFAVFLAVPLGTICFAVLSAREVDQSFVDTYSTAVSVQNVRPHWDRRVVAIVVGIVATVLALATDIYGYASFLALIGSVFVPLSAVVIVDYFALGGRRRWRLDPDAPPRPRMLVPWALGLVAYQLCAPGEVPGWSTMWTRLDELIGFTPQAWTSASVASFLVAALVTVVVAGPRTGRTRRSSEQTTQTEQTEPAAPVTSS